MYIKCGCNGYFIALSMISSFGFVFALFAFPLKIERQEGGDTHNQLGEKSRLICTSKYQDLECDKNENLSLGSNEVEKIAKLKTIKQLIVLLSDRRLLCYCCVHVFFELAYYVPIVFLSEMIMMQDRNISKQKAGSICSLVGLCCMVGKWMTALT